MVSHDRIVRVRLLTKSRSVCVSRRKHKQYKFRVISRQLLLLRCFS